MARRMVGAPGGYPAGSAPTMAGDHRVAGVFGQECVTGLCGQWANTGVETVFGIKSMTIRRPAVSSSPSAPTSDCISSGTSPAGTLAGERWRAVADHFRDVAIDEFVVMPDHVHGIVWTGIAAPVSGVGTTPGDVIRWFKSIVHAGYGKGVNQANWPTYDHHL